MSDQDWCKMDSSTTSYDDLDERSFKLKLNDVTKLCGRDFTDFLELRTKKLKRSLEGWKEILLSIHSVLMWEKQWHPGALFGTLTIIFLVLWTSDPSVLTTVSTIGLIATVCDYSVPTISASIFRKELWTGIKEKQYDEICRNIVFYYTQLTTTCSSYYVMRTVRPKMFYSVTIGLLLFLAWIGSTLNNLFLTYLILLALVMVPGMEHQGIISKYGNCLTNKFKDLSKSLKHDTKSD